MAPYSRLSFCRRGLKVFKDKFTGSFFFYFLCFLMLVFVLSFVFLLCGLVLMTPTKEGGHRTCVCIAHASTNCCLFRQYVANKLIR